MFSYEFWAIFNNSFFTKHLWAPASIVVVMLLFIPLLLMLVKKFFVNYFIWKENEGQVSVAVNSL